MSSQTSHVFELPSHLVAKGSPQLVGDDEKHFTAIARALDRSISDLVARLDATRKGPGRAGQQALDRDQEVHRLTARLRALRRFDLDLCLGHMISIGSAQPRYIGRFGLTDDGGQQLLIDWRSPAAEPFFAATHANPMGLASRRRYRWTRGRISDYWDEVFAPADTTGPQQVDRRVSLDDQSAFIASLGASRSPRMRDVLATIQSDQDAIIRAPSRGALVVDGGPGTGKTVVALHRTAYLLYSDPRLGHRRGGVLFVGPHQAYLAYVSDVLPSLGEEGVQTCTLRDLVPEGAGAVAERDPAIAKLKESAALVEAIEPAIALYEEPPKEAMEIETPWGDVWLNADDWAEAFDISASGLAHNEARDEVWEQLVTIVMDKLPAEDAVSETELRRALSQSRELPETLARNWPMLRYTDVVGDLWSVPAYLRRCAPWLAPEDIGRLQRTNPHAWTLSDLPFLDAARERLGDPGAARRKARRQATAALERQELADVIDHLVAADDSEMQVMSMLRGQDMRDALMDDGNRTGADLDLLAGPFAHIVVDEAQELTHAEWQMLLRRCPSRSFTVVGDRAQSRHGFSNSWQQRLAEAGFERITVARLTINYRTPEEIMSEAEPVIRAAVPDANVPTSVRSGGVPVAHGTIAELGSVLETWLAEHPEGIGCVIGTDDFNPDEFTFPAISGLSERIRLLTPELSKGLEFDLVVLVDPEALGSGTEGAVDRYVAMTRATQQLVVLT